MRRNSRTPSWAFLTLAESVVTSMPGAASMKQLGCSVAPRGPLTSTRHIRQTPTDSIRGW